MIRKMITYVRQDMKLRDKLLLIQLLTVLLPAILTTGVFYQWFYKNTVETVLESRLTAANSVSAQIEDTVDMLREVSDIISSTDLLKQVLALDEEDLLTGMENGDDASIELLDAYKAVLASRLEDEEISGIQIFCDEATELLNQLGNRFSDASFFSPITQIQYSYWRTIMRITGESSRLFPGYYLSDWEREYCGGMSYVQRVYYNKQGVWKEAYVVVYRKDDSLIDIFPEGSILEDELAYVIDSRNVLVTPYETNEDIGLYVVDYADLDEVFPEVKVFYSRTFGKEPAYVYRADISNIDWALIWVIPKSGITSESRALLLEALGTYGVLLLLGVCAALGVSWSLLGRIYRLKLQMQNVKEGRPAILAGETGKDEIGELMETYNYMVGQVNTAVDRELQTQTELNDMKIDLLRAQVDPHFLYNTLDLLRGLSQRGEKEQVEELVLSLTRFYRLSLNKGERFSTVEREVMLAESYMKIMNMRFGNQILFAVDVADDIMDFYVPVLIFQPILENSIIHGILEKEEQSGCISLTGSCDGENLIFLISDDGVGMDAQTCADVMEGRRSSGKGSNIGAYNTARRLQLIYGEKRSGLRYHSVPGRGTDVEIFVPVTGESAED